MTISSSHNYWANQHVFSKLRFTCCQNMTNILAAVDVLEAKLELLRKDRKYPMHGHLDIEGARALRNEIGLLMKVYNELDLKQNKHNYALMGISKESLNERAESSILIQSVISRMKTSETRF